MRIHYLWDVTQLRTLRKFIWKWEGFFLFLLRPLSLGILIVGHFRGYEVSVSVFHFTPHFKKPNLLPKILYHRQGFYNWFIFFLKSFSISCLLTFTKTKIHQYNKNSPYIIFYNPHILDIYTHILYRYYNIKKF